MFGICVDMKTNWQLTKSYLFVYFISFNSLFGWIILRYTILRSFFLYKSFKNYKINWMKIHSVNSFPFFHIFNLFIGIYVHTRRSQGHVDWTQDLCVLGKHFATELLPSLHSKTANRSKIDFVPTVTHLCDELLALISSAFFTTN